MYARAGRLVERRVWTKWLMVAFHVLFAAAWFVPGVDFEVSLAVWFLLQLGIHIGYHRYFAHVSFKTHPWFEFLLACIGCLAFQNGPLWWASMHRRHHRLSDTAGDDHSPTRGFWHAHIGWLCSPGVENIEWPLIRDLCRPIPLWMEQHQRIVHLAYGAVLACVFGWSSLLTFWIVPTVICSHDICHQLDLSSHRVAAASVSTAGFVPGAQQHRCRDRQSRRRLAQQSPRPSGLRSSWLLSLVPV